MRAGNLDRRIIIQRRTVTQSDSGEATETWATLSERPASMTPLDGDERFGGEQLVAAEQVEFVTRWALVLSNLTPLDRVVYPSSASPVGETEIYDIIQASEIGRREGVRIKAFRRLR